MEMKTIRLGELAGTVRRVEFNDGDEDDYLYLEASKVGADYLALNKDKITIAARAIIRPDNKDGKEVATLVEVPCFELQHEDDPDVAPYQPTGNAQLFIDLSLIHI